MVQAHRDMGAGVHRLKPLAVLLGALLFLGAFHAPLLRDADAKLFRGSGDGLKNYFVFGYHLKHDSTFMQFEGMNHPFGDQLGFTDAQPALVNAVKLASTLFPELADQGVAVIHWALILGWLLTALSLYLLLRHFGVHWAYAALGGVALMALSPQALRMVAAHHGLTYGWTIVLPVLYYLRVRRTSAPLRPALAGALLMLLGLFLHPYTGMIALAVVAVVLVMDRPLHLITEPRRALSLAVLLLAPVLLFLLVQGLTDHHVGRTEKPLGFFHYRADRHGILAPYTHYGDPLSKLVMPLEGPQEFEASTYLGLGVLLAGAVLLPLLLLFRLRPALLRPHGEPWPRQLTILLLAAAVLLAFAAGAPFSAAKGWLPWSVPFVGQFRSPGRFGWAAYYLFGVGALYGAWWLWTHARGNAKVLAGLFAALVPGLYLYQGAHLHRAVSAEIHKDRNVLDPDRLTEEEKGLIHAARQGGYRAMVAVPHFLNGSDELLLQPDDRTLEASLLLAYHTGIPLMSYSLARTSVPETFEQLGVFNAPWYPRPIADRFDPDDRLLLVKVAEPLSAYEAEHFARAEPVAAMGGIELRSITAGALFMDRTEELFARLDTVHDPLLPAGAWQGLHDQGAVHAEPHDDMPSPLSYHGAGAYQGVHGDFNVVASVPPGTLSPGEHIASFWVYNKGPLRLHMLVCITQQAVDAPQDAWISCGDTRFARVVNGDWSLFELGFTVDRPQDHFGIKLKGADYYRDTITVDEVLIRPADSDVFRVLEMEDGRIRTVHYNGHYITRPR